MARKYVLTMSLQYNSRAQYKEMFLQCRFNDDRYYKDRMSSKMPLVRNSGGLYVIAKSYFSSSAKKLNSNQRRPPRWSSGF